MCELEIDMATGQIELVDYNVVDDFGKVINPLLLEGQVHGGIAQGLGQAMLEKCQYESGSGQLCPQVSWITQCLAPTIFLRSNLKEMRCPAKQTHWA